MSTAKWLAVVAGLAAALGVIRTLLGESLIGVVLFFVIALSTVHYVSGGRDWLRAALGGVIAAAAYAVYLRLLPADSVSKQVGIVLFMLVLATPFVVKLIRDRQDRRHHS